MQDQNSDLFNVSAFQKNQKRQTHFFNKDTQIIKEGQRHKVIFGQMEQDKKTLHEIVSPYLYKFATTTAELATKAGNTTYEALKQGFLWVYNKFVDNVIPYAVENLPKLIFITKKQQKAVNLHQSANFEVLVEEQDYNKIPKDMGKQGKVRVVVPLGTENDKHFQQFLKNEKYEIKNYSFPIDVDSSQQIKLKQSFLIPSQSFTVIAEQVKQSHLQLQIQQPSTYKKVAFKLDKCFIFEFQGQNTIQYDMLDSIEKSKDAKLGYIVEPEQTLRRSISDKQSDPIADLINGRQKQVLIQQKVVDMTRNVHVQIDNRKPKNEYEFALN